MKLKYFETMTKIEVKRDKKWKRKLILLFCFPVLTNFAQDGGIEEVMKLTKDSMAKLL